MKKYFILILFFLTITEAKAIQLNNDVNNLRLPSCYTATNYIACTQDPNLWGGTSNLYFYSTTWSLIWTWVQTHDSQDWYWTYQIFSVISGQTHDIITYWYIVQGYYSFNGGVCAINKTNLTRSCFFLAENNRTVPWFKWVEYYSWDYYAYYWWYNGGDLSINLNTMDVWTLTPPNNNLIFAKKIYYNWNHLLWRDENAFLLYYSRVIDWNDINYQYTDLTVWNYLYKDGVFSMWLSQYGDQTRNTIIMTGSITNYELSLTPQTVQEWIINSHDVSNNTDIYWITTNTEIYSFKNNLDTPLFTVYNGELYYFDNSTYKQNLVTNNNTTYTLNNWSTNTGWTNTGTTNSGWTVPNSIGCSLDVNNDDTVWVLDGEFLVWIYNCIASGFSNISSWINWILNLTEKLNTIWTPWEQKTFTSFLFLSANADNSMMTAFNNNWTKDNFLNRILNYFIYWFYFILIIGSLFFLVSLKNNKK